MRRRSAAPSGQLAAVDSEYGVVGKQGFAIVPDMQSILRQNGPGVGVYIRARFPGRSRLPQRRLRQPAAPPQGHGHRRGIPPSTAAQVAANAEHLNAFTAHDSGPNTVDGRKSRRQFGQRSTDVITYLRSHCPVKRIELRIDELVQLYETGLGTPGAPLLTFQRNAALQLCYPAGHPNAGAQITLEQKRDLQAFGNSLARHVFGIVRREFGVHKQSALLTLTNEGTWQSISLESVGYHDDSLADLKCLMDDSNNIAI